MVSDILTEVFFAPEEAEKLRVVEKIDLARLRELAEAATTIAELSKEPDYGELTEEKDCAISLLASLLRTHPQRKPNVNVTLGLIAKLFDSRSRLVTAVSELTLKVGELTARAEQAEQDRDLAIKALADYEDAIDPTVEDVMRDLNTL